MSTERVGVGINENVMITNATIVKSQNGSSRLSIEISRIVENQPSVFDALLSAGQQKEGTSNKITVSLFGPLVSTKEDKTREDKVELAGNDLLRLRTQLTQILEQYLVTDQIDLNQAEVQFAGTGITDAATYAERVLDQDVLNKVFANLTNRFIQLITPFLSNPEYAVRFKLIRQSKEKHWATIPSRFVADRPFIELMSVPKEQSRVKFDDYEKREGLDNPDPIESSTAEAKAAEVEDSNPFAPQA